MFEIQEILKITGGKLVRGNLRDKIKGISIDSRTIKKDEFFIAIKGQNYDGHNFIDEAVKKGASGVIIQTLNPKLQTTKKIPFILVKDTIKALGDIASFHRRRFSIPIIAITGSNGKTTTKEMIAFCLEKRFSVLKNEGTKNNFIGLPLTLLKLNQRHDLAVVELGTNHFGEIEYLTAIAKPNFGVITNIGPAHLENLFDLEGVFKEETSLIKGLDSNGYGIINGDDGFLRRLVKKSSVFTYGIKRTCDLMAEKLNCNGQILKFKISGQNFSLNTAGIYNTYNALPAIFIGLLFGLSLKSMALNLKKFQFPKGRLNLKRYKNILIFDDTYNSNPLSLRLALDAISRYKRRKIFVMGDMLELGSKEDYFHREIAKFIKKAKIYSFISLGRLSKITAEELKKKDFCKKVFITDSHDEVKNILKNLIKPKDIVLIKGSRKMGMEKILEVFK